MTNDAEEASNLARVAGDTEETALVGGEDRIQGALGALILCRLCLSGGLSP